MQVEPRIQVTVGAGAACHGAALFPVKWLSRGLCSFPRSQPLPSAFTHAESSQSQAPSRPGSGGATRPATYFWEEVWLRGVEQRWGWRMQLLGLLRTLLTSVGVLHVRRRLIISPVSVFLAFVLPSVCVPDKEPCPCYAPELALPKPVSSQQGRVPGSRSAWVLFSPCAVFLLGSQRPPAFCLPRCWSRLHPRAWAASRLAGTQWWGRKLVQPYHGSSWESFIQGQEVGISFNLVSFVITRPLLILKLEFPPSLSTCLWESLGEIWVTAQGGPGCRTASRAGWAGSLGAPGHIAQSVEIWIECQADCCSHGMFSQFLHRVTKFCFLMWHLSCIFILIQHS